MNFSRYKKEQISYTWMLISIGLVIAMPICIGTGLGLKSKTVLMDNSLFGILFSSNWKPLSGEFGLLPFIMGSLWVTFLSLAIAAPVCLFSALHLSYYAPGFIRRCMRPVIDILAGIPSVVYGVWGIIIIVPFVGKYLAPMFHIETSGYTLLAGAMVLAVMIIPFILNILLDIFNSIPVEYQEVSLSLGATKWQTVKSVLMRKSRAGIISSLGLGVSRAFGETIAVLMVAGNVAIIPKSPLEPGYPLPALIANNYGEMLSIPSYDSALMFSALVLFVVVMLFNLASRVTILNFEKSA